MVIGITGHTGSGKSYVARALAKYLAEAGHSVGVLDADVMARELRDQSPAVKAKIIALLGKDVYDVTGISLPDKISARIFGEANHLIRQQYEQIFLESVPLSVKQHIQAAAHKTLLLDFFLLFTYLKDCLNQIDATMLIVCSPATQLKRLTDPPRAIAPELALARMENQQRRMPLADIRTKVDWVIENELDHITPSLNDVTANIITRLKNSEQKRTFIVNDCSNL